jgi:ribosomal protein S18 acetylase RimI-like enzyme
MLSIRPATEADIAAVTGIAPAGAERREAIAEWIGAGQCHVAWVEGQAVGYAVLTRSFFRSPFIELLVVSETYRRQGIGRALVAHCISLTPADAKLWTSTNLSNAPMRALLPQLGFHETGIVEHLDPGDPELVFLRWSQLPLR